MPQVTTESVEESCDHSGPIRGQYPGHVITLDQSEERDMPQVTTECVEE